MFCSNCSVGTIRVFPMFACCCGLPVMICDNCWHRFIVKHDDHNMKLLPPEAELEDCGPPSWLKEEKELEEILIAMGVKPPPKQNLSVLPTVEDMRKLVEAFDNDSFHNILNRLDGVIDELGNKIINGEILTDKENLQFELAEYWLMLIVSL